MRWAVISSLILHSVFMGLVFKGGAKKTGQYPPVMMVRLASLPVVKGAASPASAETSKKTTAKKTEKPESSKEKPRMAEVNRRKRPERKKETPKPEAEVKKETAAEEAIESEKKGLPEGVELGSEFGSARLDATGFESPYYLNVLFSKIRNRWDNPYEGIDTVHCTIYFVVDRKGKITDSAIENSSGLSAYDHAALRAVLAARPPPLPNQFGSEELGIHLQFRYLPYN
jgi:protein TonB